MTDDQLAEACPCKHITPCHERCTCANPLSSSGCLRCCTYGSREQQIATAERLTALSARVEVMEAVVEAAKEWAKYGRDDGDDEHDLLRAVRALRANEEAGK